MSEKLKNLRYFNYFGIVGGVLVIVSTLFPWFSTYNIFTMYIISGASPDSFIYFFPMMSGIICLVGSFLFVYRPELKINSVIIEMIGLGFNLLFSLDFITNHGQYLLNIQIGFYIFAVGFALIFWEVIAKLYQKEEGSNESAEQNAKTGKEEKIDENST